MEMVKDVSTNLSHSFSVSERKNIIISGVVKIDSFDSEEFLLETVQGYMNIKGENLEVVKLDTYQGNVTIIVTYGLNDEGSAYEYQYQINGIK